LIDAVRGQHLTRATDFLVDQLGLPETEARDRIFFVSAKQILEHDSAISHELSSEWNRQSKPNNPVKT
jgi:hypothetical protein